MKLKLPGRVRTVVVFGGSFDPPHFMHAIAPLTAVNRVFGKAGWLLYVPAACNPHKPDGPRAADDHRVAMLRLALDVPGQRSIWTDEIHRAAWLRSRGVRRPSYTIDTLRRLRKALPPSVKLRLLVGSDQLRTFHKWKEPRAIIRLAEPLILPREPFDKVSDVYRELDRDFWTQRERAQWCTRLAPVFPIEAASSDLRAAIPNAPKQAAHWNRRKALGGLITPVAAYIIEHNLYGFRKGPPIPPKPGWTPARPVGDEPAIVRRVTDPVLARAQMDAALAAAMSTPGGTRRSRR